MLVAAQPTRGLDVGAIEFVHRRLVEERDEGRAILLVSFELDEVLSLSDRILVIYEGADRGRVRARRLRGGDRLRDDWAAGAEKAHACSEPQGAEQPGTELVRERRPTGSRRASAGCSCRSPPPSSRSSSAGSSSSRPATTRFGAYKAIFDGTGLNWFFPWVRGDERFSAALDLQQTLIITTPLMLTALAVAFAFRCGMFNIGGQGQYFVGLMAALYLGHGFAGMPRPAARPHRDASAAILGRRGLGGHRRLPQGRPSAPTR